MLIIEAIQKVVIRVLFGLRFRTKRMLFDSKKGILAE